MTQTTRRPAPTRSPRGRRARAEARARARRRRNVIAAVVALVAVVALGVVVQSLRSGTPPTATAAVPAPLSASGGLKIGTGAVTVDLYSDFQCPACRSFEQRSGDTLASLVEQGRITLAYHPMSFLGPESVRAASAATAAFAQGRLLEYAGVLFDDQPAEGSGGYQTDELVALARRAGVPDAAAFEHDLRSDRYGGWVATVNDGAHRRGVTATPTVLVDGRQLTDVTPTGLASAVSSAHG